MALNRFQNPGQTPTRVDELTSTNLNVGSVATSSPITLSVSPFIRNVPTVSSDYNITSQFNEMSVGPVTINTGVTVTIQSGATWSIV